MTKKQITEIVNAVGKNFRTFGGDAPHNGNPIAAAMMGKPYSFAAGVDVEEVVRFVIKEIKKK